MNQEVTRETVSEEGIYFRAAENTYTMPSELKLITKTRTSSNLSWIVNPEDVRLSLNVADRLRILNGLIEQAPDRPTYAILDDRMPPEFDHFRIVRSPLDPHLLRIEPKPPAEGAIKFASAPE